MAVLAAAMHKDNQQCKPVQTLSCPSAEARLCCFHPVPNLKLILALLQLLRERLHIQASFAQFQVTCRQLRAQLLHCLLLLLLQLLAAVQCSLMICLQGLVLVVVQLLELLLEVVSFSLQLQRQDRIVRACKMYEAGKTCFSCGAAQACIGRCQGSKITSCKLTMGMLQQSIEYGMIALLVVHRATVHQSSACKFCVLVVHEGVHGSRRMVVSR